MERRGFLGMLAGFSIWPFGKTLKAKSPAKESFVISEEERCVFYCSTTNDPHPASQFGSLTGRRVSNVEGRQINDTEWVVTVTLEEETLDVIEQIVTDPN